MLCLLSLPSLPVWKVGILVVQMQAWITEAGSADDRLQTMRDKENQCQSYWGAPPPPPTF